MTITRAEADPTVGSVPDAVLSIGELAMRTGVSVGTLRMWETRYAFPQPHRLASGHRRYPLSDVQRVRDVLRRRERGIRLDVAIDQVETTSADDPGDLAPHAAASAARRVEAHSPSRDAAGAASPGRELETDGESVFAMLRRRHGGLSPQRLRKPVLISLSRAMEDDFCSAPQAEMSMFGAFQRHHHYESSRPRWEDLTRTCQAAYVFADFDSTDDPQAVGSAPVRIGLPDDSPFLREWAVVCVGSTRSMALSAWELPGQAGRPDAERRFEAVWTTDAAVVREVAVACARVAARYGVPDAATVAAHLEADEGAEPSAPASSDVERVGQTHRQLTSLLNRLVPYLDRDAGRPPHPDGASAIA